MSETSPPITTDGFGELRRLIERSTDMLARHAPDATYLYASPACRHLLGYDPAELVGRSAYEVIHPADVEVVEAAHEALLTSTELQTTVYRVRHQQGHDVWLETTSHALRDDRGTVTEIQTSSRDVTRRHTAELALRESEERFRLAMTHAPIGMAIVGLDGSFVDVNDSLCEMLGRPPDDLRALTFQDITHPDDLDTDLEYVEQLVSGAIRHYTMEKRYRLPSGAHVWALLSGSIVRDDDGQPRYFLAQIVDIDERKASQAALERANRELERSNDELERFAAVAAHDLRNPIATVRGFLDLLHDRYAPLLDPQGQQIVEVSRRVTTQMSETVEGLLTLARVGSERLELQDLALQPVVDEVLEALGPALDAADARIEIGVLPRVKGDRTQIRVLFQNLLANAIRFRAPDRGLRVSIAARREGRSWRVAVQDDGTGFEPSEAEKIFEPFTVSSRGTAARGTGIGLATCRRIVERHGGAIRAVPTDPGARFEFTLVAASEADEG